MGSLSHTFGRFCFDVRKACAPAKSEIVPIKQNQPQPIRPTSGDKMMNTAHTNNTKVTTPQYMECQINPKAKYWKKIGVSSKKTNLDKKFKE